MTPGVCDTRNDAVSWRPFHTQNLVATTVNQRRIIYLVRRRHIATPLPAPYRVAEVVAIFPPLPGEPSSACRAICA